MIKYIQDLLILGPNGIKFKKNGKKKNLHARSEKEK